MFDSLTSFVIDRRHFSNRFALWNVGIQIDRIVIFEESTPINLIKKIKPKFIFKGDDYKKSQVVGNKEITKWKGSVILIKCTKNKSTSKIIERIKNGT